MLEAESEAEMRIEFRSRGIADKRAMSEHVRRRLGFAIGRFAGALRWVKVRVEDVNGPRGGVDKRCVVSASGEGFEERVVEVRDVNAYAAVDQAIEALGRSVARALDRAKGAIVRGLRVQGAAT